MYLCKIASLEEMNRKWDYEIEHSAHDRNNWIVWKQTSLERFKKGNSIPYYGILDGNIICEATAMLNSEAVQNSEGLVGDKVVYLSAFRTIKEYQGKGYFSKLMKFMPTMVLTGISNRQRKHILTEQSLMWTITEKTYNSIHNFWVVH